ncbi:inhibitor of apoptosis-promoting Bax1-domain-containing protein [Jimgerdemannia flammicorona]|uniref:Inhibitor of apoptosis-promoting Bax1-domain-containing protein n=2 Tax=Jimgerdemannia flammicorona TaxID=994334 RepID=A0A433Q9N8_9FUNG|nr:inhibitor of apoptosis-promoting Bax1-domain-containing protein [Jimgerdemannia flammicorona]
MNGIFSSFDRPMPPLADVFKNVTTISRPVKDHLVRVYATLTGMMLVAAAGAYVEIYNLFLFRAGLLSSLLSMATMIGIQMLPYNVENGNKRRLPSSKACPLATSSHSSFTSTPRNCPFFHITFASPHAYPYTRSHCPRPFHSHSGSTVLLALTSSVLIFACFTVCAVLAERRTMIYLGALLSSAVSLLFWTSLANSFIGSRMLWSAELYVGLLVFAAYIIFDTQLIVEKASLGNLDVAGHCVELFVDLVAIFVRILIIISKSRDDEKRKERERDGRRRRR